MSRSYRMDVEVSGYKGARKEAITAACKKEWKFSESANGEKGSIELAGQSYLVGGEFEQEFADRLAQAVWKANRGSCRVTVTATFLDQVPEGEIHERSRSDYKAWRKTKRGTAVIRQTNIQQAAEAFAVLRDMATFDRLGGSGSFFGRLHVFEHLLKDEHARAGETDPSKGAYRYKGMMQYGNIVSYEPSTNAAKRFIEMGYSTEHLTELHNWYQGKGAQGSVDAVALGVCLSEFLRHR